MPNDKPFKNYAIKYYENNLAVIPCSGKRPIVRNWNRYSKKLPLESTVQSWIEEYPGSNIGLVCGEASGLIALDIDVEDEGIIEEMLRVIPSSPLMKKGKKGITLLYKLHLTNKKRKRPLFASKTSLKIGSGIGEFIFKGVTILPPSIHPDNKKPYIWVNHENSTCLMSTPKTIVLENVPELSEIDVENIILKLNSMLEIKNPFRGKLSFKKGNRNNSYVKLVTKLYCKNYTKEQTITEVLKIDRRLDDPLFLDKNEFTTNDDEINASTFVASVVDSLKKREIKKDPDDDHKMDNQREEAFQLLRKVFKDPSQDKLLKNYWFYLNGEIRMSFNLEKIPTSRYFDLLICSHYADGIDFKNKTSMYRGYIDQYFHKETKQVLIINLDDYKYSGEDPIKDFYGDPKNIEVEFFSNDELVQLEKLSLKKIIDKLFHEKDVQNHFTLMYGKQEIGKDTLLKAQYRFLKPYFGKFSIDIEEKELYRLMSQYAVIQFSEVDKVMGKKSKEPMLKAALTAEEATIRKMYTPDFVNVKLYATLVGSVNYKRIFSDPTGQRRYIMYQINHLGFIDDRFFNTYNMLALGKHLSETNFDITQELKDKVRKHQESLTSTVPANIFLNVWSETFDDIYKTLSAQHYNEKDMVPYMSLKQVFHNMFKGQTNVLPDKLSTREAIDILTEQGYVTNVHNHLRFYKEPRMAKVISLADKAKKLPNYAKKLIDDAEKKKQNDDAEKN